MLSYHVIVEGECWTGLDEPGGGAARASIALERGDVVVYPRGDPYFLTPDPATPPGGADAAAMLGLLAGVADGSIPAIFSRGQAGADRTRFVCGFLGSDAPPYNPLLQALPRMLIVRHASGRLERLVELALAEVDGAGAASVRERLSESMFIETVRSDLALGTPGWLDGLGNPIVGQALSLMHGAPAEPWTMASLAHQAGASRSTLADRFTRLVGQPPMRYLAAWRMRLSADRLGRRPAPRHCVVSDGRSGTHKASTGAFGAYLGGQVSRASSVETSPFSPSIGPEVRIAGLPEHETGEWSRHSDLNRGPAVYEVDRP